MRAEERENLGRGEREFGQRENWLRRGEGEEKEKRRRRDGE